MRTLALGLALLAIPLLGCHDDSRGPSLMVVSGLSPTHLGVGDQLEIAGSGFPEGQAVDVIFRGDLYHPGREVEEGVEIVARTQSSTTRSLSVLLSDELQASFTGPKGEGLHATFRGDLWVSFSPSKVGSAPIQGMLADVVLDVTAPLLPPVLQRQRDAQTREALGFLGITLADASLGGCCVVGTTTGRAAAAGIRSGDRLLNMDGVTVKEPSDLTPQGRTRSARLTLRDQGDGPPVTRDIDVQGFRQAAPSELRLAVALVFGVVAVVGLLYGPLNVPLTFLVYLLSPWQRRLRLRVPTKAWFRRVRAGTIHQLTTNEVPEHAMARLASVLSFVAMTTLLTVISLRVELVARELDLPLLVLFSTTLAIVCACIEGARAEVGRLRAMGASVLRAILFQLPLLGLVVMVGREAGTLGTVELTYAQTPWPPGWFAFHDPGMMGLWLLTFATFLPIVRSVRLASADGSPQAKPSTTPILLASVHDWVRILVLVLATMGSSLVPFVSSATTSNSLGWQLLGAGVLQLKCLIVMGAVRALRSLLGGATTAELTPLMLRRGVSMLLLTVVVSELWSFATGRWALGWLEMVVRTVLFGSLVAAVGWVLLRALVYPLGDEQKTTVQPWL